LKMFGCRGMCNGRTNCVNHTSGLPHKANPGWHFFLYNLTADRAEESDLWAVQRADAKAMLGRFQDWQQSVVHSKGPAENGCFPAPPTPPPPTPPPSPPPPPPPGMMPVPGMQDVAERCGSADGVSVLGQQGAPDAGSCGQLCVERKGCKFISFSPGCKCCWLYAACDQPEKGTGWVYKDWSTYGLGSAGRN
jgi:hypothetical protein